MTIRELIVDWLTSSRYVKWLEARHIEQRQDYERRLDEKDARIKELRIELQGLKLECDRMRIILGQSWTATPQVSEGTARPPLVPAFNGYIPKGWEAELAEIMEEEKNGTNGERRSEVYQSSTDDGA